MFTSNSSEKTGSARRAYYMRAAWSRRSRHDLDAEELLTHEHVVAVLERCVLLNAEKSTVLRSQIGEHHARRSLAVHRHLRMPAADDRVLGAVDTASVAAQGHHFTEGAHAQADVAAAQELDQTDARRTPRRCEHVRTLLVGAQAG